MIGTGTSEDPQTHFIDFYTEVVAQNHSLKNGFKLQLEFFDVAKKSIMRWKVPRLIIECSDNGRRVYIQKTISSSMAKRIVYAETSWPPQHFDYC
jgi:hypothetical protein